MAPKKKQMAEGSRQLVEVDYPIYAVASTGDGQILLGGGGGKSRTGVPNILEMHKLDDAFTLVAKHDCVDHAVMNMAVHPESNTVAVGMDEICKLFSFPTDDGLPEKPSKKEEGKDTTGALGGFEETASITTDFHPEEGYQKAVRFDVDGTRVATGGADGHIRIWEYPSMKKIKEIKASDGLELKDVCFNRTGSHIASVATRSKDLAVWDTSSGEEIKRLQFKEAGGLYQFNAVRYIVNEDKVFLLALATLPRCPTYLVLWETDTWTVINKKVADKGPCTCMEVSPGHSFIAVGTAEGSVAIFESMSLQRIHVAKEIHPLFITCVAFTAGSTAVLSASVDRRCVLTNVARTESSFDMSTLLRAAMRVLLFAILMYQLLRLFHGEKYGFK